MPSSLVESDLATILWISLALSLSGFFCALRVALQHSHPARILGETEPEKKRERIAQLLERVDSLAASAAIFKITCDLFFVSLLLGIAAQDGPLEWTHLAIALGLAAPVLLLLTDALPTAIARARGDEILLRVLPAFRLIQMPIGLLAMAVAGLRRAILRVLGIRDVSPFDRKIFEGLREVIEESSFSGDLDDTEREIIGNVMEFGDVDAAEVMTPRTEIHAISVDEGLERAIELFAEAGHSRIPVFEESIDNIIGTVTALVVTETMAANRMAKTTLRDVLRPAFLVPETKLVSELLTEFRARKQKMAIVLDEYGGTAGIVTLGDVIAEIVGDIADEFEETDEAIRYLDDGVAEVPAGLHVSEVNEALGLDIPEEQDFETLGGFVLAELGRFPKKGEGFIRRQVHYSVLEASDRRVLKVAVNRSA